MPTRPLCDTIRGWIHYLRVKSIGGNAVLLSLPYQVNSLLGHVRLLMCKGNETNIEIGE